MSIKRDFDDIKAHLWDLVFMNETEINSKPKNLSTQSVTVHKIFFNFVLLHMYHYQRSSNRIIVNQVTFSRN